MSDMNMVRIYEAAAYSAEKHLKHWSGTCRNEG
jgi:hypothetical protein